MIFPRNTSSLPWIISYPRSGSNWIHCSLELYAQRRRHFPQSPAPISLLPAEIGRDYFFIHSHNNINRPDRVAYLQRDPVDVLFSQCWAMNMHRQENMLNNFLRTHTQLWRSHVKKWTDADSKFKADVIVTYENMLASPAVEFQKLTDFLELEWDEAKALRCLGEVTKERLVNQNRMGSYFGPRLIEPEYAEQRKQFREQYGEMIYSTMTQPVEQAEAPAPMPTPPVHATIRSKADLIEARRAAFKKRTCGGCGKSAVA